MEEMLSCLQVRRLRDELTLPIPNITAKKKKKKKLEVAQMVKSLPAMQETWVWSLGWEDPLGNGMAIAKATLKK